MSLNILASTLSDLPRNFKKSLAVFADIIICFLSTWFAFVLRFDDFIRVSNSVVLAFVVSVLLAVPIFISFGLYRTIFRFGGWYAMVLVVKAMSIYGLIYVVLFTFVGLSNVPRSVGIIQPILLFMGVGIIRATIKFFLNDQIESYKKSFDLKIALIYGAGSAGRQLASGLRQANEIKLIGFVDDNSLLWGGVINGLPVYSPNQIPALTGSNPAVTDILLAIPSVNRSRQREILQELAAFPVHVRTLPGLFDLVNGNVKIHEMREVEIDDVLGREPVQPITQLMNSDIRDKVVLVTGAGGSIGSELSRQIVKLKPKKIILFELNEFALYSLERELTQEPNAIEVSSILGSVSDKKRLISVMQHFQVQTVYHAAAYKHVPLVEINPIAGIVNNVFGTLAAVEAAIEAGVNTFVLISTDKAVRPTNVMGCSKRLAELILQAKNIKQDMLRGFKTKLTMVRFGNVLGSSGSVLPIFRDQIKNGGPVTVTHPDIIRYFMTIPEAAQLVIQAGAIGRGGDVMVLDMGEPVKIVNLAKQMIHLSGFTEKDEKNPNGDIQIQFTGLRPGEKLFEELLIGGDVISTDHPRIMRSIEHALDWSELEEILSKLNLAVEHENLDEIFLILKRAVPEFNYSANNGLIYA